MLTVTSALTGSERTGCASAGPSKSAACRRTAASARRPRDAVSTRARPAARFTVLVCDRSVMTRLCAGLLAGAQLVDAPVRLHPRRPRLTTRYQQSVLNQSVSAAKPLVFFDLFFGVANCGAIFTRTFAV